MGDQRGPCTGLISKCKDLKLYETCNNPCIKVASNTTSGINKEGLDKYQSYNYHYRFKLFKFVVGKGAYRGNIMALVYDFIVPRCITNKLRG